MLLMWVQSHPLNTSINEKWHCRCTKRRKPDQSASRASFCMSGLQVFVTVLLQKMIIWISLHIDNKLLPSAWLVSTPSVLLFPGVLFQALDIEIPIYIFLWLVTCFRLRVSERLQEMSALRTKQCVRKRKFGKNVARTHPLCSKAVTTLPYLLYTRAMFHCEDAPGTFRGLGSVCVSSLSVFSICTA